MISALSFVVDRPWKCAAKYLHIFVVTETSLSKRGGDSLLQRRNLRSQRNWNREMVVYADFMNSVES